MAARVKTPGYSFLDYMLLGIVRLHPEVSGYQLRTIIDDSVGYFFHAHLSQIYPALRRLTDDGLLTYSEMSREGKPDLKLYSITESGEELLRTWLLEPFEFETTRVNADRYFIKLILMDHLGSDELSAYIESGIKAFSEQEQVIAAGRHWLDTGDEPDVSDDEDELERVLWGAEIELIIRDLKVRVDWLEHLKADLERIG